MGRKYLIATSLLVAVAAVWLTASADETSTQDKLRILYSNQFTFTNDGVPLLTIELMSGQSEIQLSSGGGVLVRPDGEGGSEVVGGEHWTVTIEKAASASVREWTVVATLGPDDQHGLTMAMETWRKRGYKPRTFEIGTVFGVEGEVIDTREVLVALAPVATSRGARRAREIAAAHGVDTRVHYELHRRPRGMIVARTQGAVVRNPSVIWFAPKKAGGTLTLEDVEVGGGGSQLETRRETRRYFGSVYVAVGRDGKLVAVNAVPGDKLLAGLVPSEIYPDAPSAALAAQAIAARTELLQKIGTRHLTDPYLLCSHQHCQVYSGAGREHPRTTREVQNTRGLVLLREGGGLVDARYSAACGGHGEHNENIWGGTPDPSLRGHLDMPAESDLAVQFAGGIDENNIDRFLNLPAQSGYCGATRYGKGRFRWKKQVKTGELSRFVAAHYPRVGTVRSIEPLDRGLSGRIGRLRIQGSKGTAIAHGDLHIRRLLGGLRSSLFVVEKVGKDDFPEAFEFRGAGFGHGVGMCQIGAIGMAQNGKAYREILAHYYLGSRIQRLY